MRLSSTESDKLPNLSQRGLFLPSWAIMVVASAIIAVVSLAVESRLRLGNQELDITELRVEFRESVNSLRTEAQRDREQNRIDEKELSARLQRVESSIAAICAATKARCP